MRTQEYKQFNCYQVLGVSHTATLAEIRSAFKKTSLRSHPDHGGSHEAQVRVNLAYEVLSDPIERQAHDIFWRVTPASSFVQPQPTSSYSYNQTKARPAQPRQEPPRTQAKPSSRKPLSGLKKRIDDQIEGEKARIWKDLDNRSQKKESELRKKYSDYRQETLLISVGFFLFGVIAVYIQVWWLWIAVLYLGGLCLSRLQGIEIANRHFSLFEPKAQHHFRQYAHQLAQESCSQDVNNLNRYLSSLASLTELLLHPSTYDDSEEQVARRLAASFFLMGYTPLEYDRENRTIRFTDGEEEILARFRHRAGAATNITFVEKMVNLMYMHRAKRGFLFCSPGLSGNAAQYANDNRVRWYTLETMNQWIGQVSVSDYSGPSGDIFVQLDKLTRFLSTVSLVITSRSYKPRSRYSRYRSSRY
jgi:hypothetical protein